MSGKEGKRGHPKWKVESLNVGVLATDGDSIRKMAWLKTAPSGIHFGVGTTFGAATKFSYLVGGEFWRETTFPPEYGIRLPRRDHMSTLKPIQKVRGLAPFYAAGIRYHEYLPEFPFKRLDEAVYLDARAKGGVSFNLGLLEAGNFEALKELAKSSLPPVSYHIVTKTDPWIAIWSY